MTQFKKTCDEVAASKSLLQQIVDNDESRASNIDAYRAIVDRQPKVLEDVEGFKRRALEKNPAKRLYGPQMTEKVLAFVKEFEEEFEPLLVKAKSIMDPLAADASAAAQAAEEEAAAARAAALARECEMRVAQTVEAAESPIRAALVDEERAARDAIRDKRNAGIAALHKTKVELERETKESLAVKVNEWAARAPSWPLVQVALVVLRRALRRRLAVGGGGSPTQSSGGGGDVSMAQPSGSAANTRTLPSGDAPLGGSSAAPTPTPPPSESAISSSSLNDLPPHGTPTLSIAADIILVDIVASVHHAMTAALEQAHGASVSAGTVVDRSAAFRSDVARHVGGALLLLACGYRRVIRPPSAGGGGAFVLREPNPVEDRDKWAAWYESTDSILTLLSKLCELFPTSHARSLEAGVPDVSVSVAQRRKDRAARLDSGVWEDVDETRPYKIRDTQQRALKLQALLNDLTSGVDEELVKEAADIASAIHLDVMSDRGDAGSTSARVRELVASLVDAFAFAQVAAVAPGSAADEAGLLPGDMIVYWGGVAARGEDYASEKADGRSLLGSVAAATADAAGSVLDVVVLRSIAPGPIALSVRVPPPVTNPPRGGDISERGGVGVRVDPLSGPLRPAIAGEASGWVRRRAREEADYGGVQVDDAVRYP